MNVPLSKILEESNDYCRRMSPLKKSAKWTNLQKPPESLEFEKW